MSARRALELAALSAGVAVWSYVGWDGALWDARFQALLHLLAGAALIGLGVFALRGGELPRTRLELPILALLLAFAVASLSAWNAGLSARALAGIVATVAMLPVALLALRHRPGWTAAVVSLPIFGLSVASLAMIGWRRVEWILAGGPGLPPIRLEHEGTPFGSVAVPPFVLMAALPVALLIPHRGLRLAVVAALAAVGVPLTLLSGSRSAWIALAVALVVLGAPVLRARLRSRRLGAAWTPRRVGMGIAAAGLAVVAIAFVAPRIAESGSLSYRASLWRDTLLAWRADPLLGLGPGAMPFARQAAAPALSFPVRQPHSHDVPLGILGDAGLVGLVAAGALLVTFVVVAGPWRTRHLPGRAAFAVLVGFAAGMVFEDLTFVPNFNLLVLLLVAMALTDAGAVTWRAARLSRGSVGAGALAFVVAIAALGTVGLAGDAAAVAYRLGSDAAEDLQWPAAVAWYSRAGALDAWQPTTPKALSIAADHAGDHALALRAARRAVELNPGDGRAWANVALLCLADGDAACAREAADQVVARATPGRELINAALVYEALGDRAAADDAYRLSAESYVWTTLTHGWPRPIALSDAPIAELGPGQQLNEVIARGAMGQAIDPGEYDEPMARALAFAILGNWADADAEIGRATAAARGASGAWDLAALFARHRGRDPTRDLEIGDVARGQPLSEGPYQVPGLTYDIATFRAYPADELVSGAERLLAQTAWPWALDPLLP